MECKDGVCYRRPAGGALELGCFELDGDAATLEWAPRHNHEKFEVQIEEAAGWRTMSDKLTASFVKKKNLTPGQTYNFRVRGWAKGTWSEFSPVASVTASATKPCAAPQVGAMEAQGDGNFAALLHWTAVPNASAYAIEMRTLDSPTLEWTLISDKLKSTSVRKKNLKPAKDYIFRTRAQQGDKWTPWSSVSTPVPTMEVSSTLKSYVGSTLVRGGGAQEQVSTNSLGGKVVALYFSAHWCPPCKMKTQQMRQAYPSIKHQGLPFEIVFVSADHDEQGYNAYLSEMPWVAMPWHAQREQLMQQFQVSGIPKMVVFSKSGRMITDSAAGAPLSPELVKSWAQHA
mmetsp:Transcript_8052/g.14275  ORF Transcript_8052/g.14275 Transcript_8052/m.14275 type:complete len:343 (-) Transcript_8052:78-1106(-)|eukprot:CAMPEP_0184528160 /NCGR_PEP_ID=MMETSP0198_2-20121128/11638_1 /TAXON_ID=1112570 /ORGANISM="Thraustochytrium sp., Strain LLF1b" /LENGTH=342 /DNA_ID=CAMNT_0026919977 /DNA_START=99 /DNA_END=1124 /DNA_ORIENTATION=-